MPSRHRFFILALSWSLACAIGVPGTVARADDGARLPPPPGRPAAAPTATGPATGPATATNATNPTKPRALRLPAADVARLALRNDPVLRARALDPAIADTFVDEAIGEFDPLLGARLAAGRRRSEVFFDPSAFGPGGGSAGSSFQSEDHVGGEVSVTRTEVWGGRWNLGYGATSTDRGGASSVTSLQPRYDGALSLGYTHPLMRGAGRDVRLSRFHEAERRTEAAQHDLTRSSEETIARAEQIYWDLAGALATRALRQKSVAVADSLVAVTQARLDAETAVPADVAEAEAGRELRRVDLISAENDVRNTSDRLRELILPFSGENPDLGLVIEPIDRPAPNGGRTPQPVTMPDLAAMFAARGDVLAASSRVEAAKTALIRAENDVDPEINAFATGLLRGLGSGLSNSNEQLADHDAYDWEVGLELSVPFGNVAALARLRRGYLEIRQLQRRLDAVRNTSVGELRRANNDLAAAAARIVAAEASVAAAELQLAAERARLQNGASTPFRVLEVEEQVTAAESAAIQARVDWEKGLVASDLAAGRVLSARGLAAPATEDE